jgi:SulP family sulfate permease
VNDLRADLLAGATVALVGLPQCLAYATMSGLPPEYGLATAIVPGVVAAIVGRSRHVITGPTNTTGLLVLGALVPYLGSQGLLRSDGLGWLATLTLLCGLLRFVFAAAGGTVLMRFIPESVLAGFTVGAGILIAVMQLDEALGLPAVSGAGFWAEYQGLSASIASGLRPAPLALAFAVLSVVAVAIGRRSRSQIPTPLLVVVAGAIAAWTLRLDATVGLPLISDRASIPGGWPPGALPDLHPEVIARLLTPAAAIVLIGTLELFVTVRADDPRSNMRREIVAQGCANAVGAFASAFPASASLGRSTLLHLTHPRSRAGAAFAAMLILPILLFGSRPIAFIPQACLAGVLFITATAMVRQPSFGRMWRASGASRMLFGVTAVGTLVLPLPWSVFIGAGLGLVIHLARTSTPRVRALMFRDDRLVPIDASAHPEVVVLEVSGAVHYAAVEPFLEQVERQVPPSARLVIVDLSHAHELRFTALRALEWWASDLSKRGIQLRLAGVTTEVRDLLRGADSRLEYAMWDPEPGRSAWRSYNDPR